MAKALPARQFSARRSGHALLLALLISLGLSVAPAAAQSVRDRPPTDEIIYFVLPDRFENGDTRNDRGGLKGGRLDHGFDPTHKGFYLGGDLKGLTARLDYIQGLGATAIWLGPIFKNRPVQGAPGQESAGYHGYWITDFTTVDPHLGSEADLKALVSAAHGRGMKVYLDIVTNHTADIIRYAECPDSACAFRNRQDYPWSRKGGIGGEPINPGFAGDGPAEQTAENFAKLTDPRWAYTPFVPRGLETAKKPDWLNDPLLYSNRGNSNWKGESVVWGDFVGLDDLMTSNPRVRDGMIEIYKGWIDRFGIDGFRIDTAKHVNPEFWQAFVPAILAHARARGIPNFHVFGEVFQDTPDPGFLARFTRVDGYPAVIDFAFKIGVGDLVARNKAPSSLQAIFFLDPVYAGGEEAALQLPTFVSNHDQGRLSHDVVKANPVAGPDERLARMKLGHSMLILLRGVPTLYSGDEQGFSSDGNDQDAREPMFASKVPSYLDNRLIGTARTHAEAQFDPAHPLYRHISSLSRLRLSNPALMRGTQRVLAADTEGPGLFAVARRLPGGDRAPLVDMLLMFNTSASPLKANVPIDPRIDVTRSLFGSCPQPAAPGSLSVEIEPFGTLVCAGAVAVR